jgi:zinc-finger of transposase IS204/IS1001/IS1096/IS1165
MAAAGLTPGDRALINRVRWSLISSSRSRTRRSLVGKYSRYERRLADAPVGGRRVVIRLKVRRLFCDDPACPRQTFAEQVPGLTTLYGRKTALLAAMQQDIAVALAGRAGCRLAGRLSAPASRQVLLRLVMAVPDPAAPARGCSGPVTSRSGAARTTAPS